MDERGVADKKRCHSEAGCIADAEIAFVSVIERHEAVWVGATRHMLDQIKGKTANKIDRQHFCLEWRR